MIEEALERAVARYIGRCGCSNGYVEEGPAGATWTSPCGRCEGSKLPLRDAREVIKLVRESERPATGR